MPSIPQSLLWISLVVLWLFVLVPMLISRRDAVRRTSDVALATRVLNGDAGARLLKRTGPATGHRSDPGWKPEQEWADEPIDGAGADAGEEDRDADTDEIRLSGPVTAKVAVVGTAEVAEPDYLDVLVVDEDVVDEDVIDEASDDEASDAQARLEAAAGPVDQDEEVEDSSDVASEDSPAPVAPALSRRRRFDTKTAAAVSARKYAFRKRMLMAMAGILLSSATAAFEVTPTAWWICGIATAVTMLYLAYLRRQTRIEEKVRRRRTQRLARARLGVENTADRAYHVVPSRLRRPGAVVLEIDDEDPIFEHLDYAMPQRAYGWSRDLPRAVGQ